MTGQFQFHLRLYQNEEEDFFVMRFQQYQEDNEKEDDVRRSFNMLETY